MIESLRAEFRKMLTVRSTYFIILFSLFMIGLFAFYAQGLRFGEGGPPGSPIPPVPADYLQQAAFNAAMALSTFIALIGVLLVAHEYRYNTIMYTLTISRSRSKTLLAKIIAVTITAILLIIFLAAMSALTTALGLLIKGVDITPQTFYFKDLLWRICIYSWGYAMAGLLIAVLVRNQIGAIASFLFLPGMVEVLLSLVLKGNAKYLPFTALNAVVTHNEKLSAPTGALVFLIYLVVGWMIAWILFLRRDAN